VRSESVGIYDIAEGIVALGSLLLGVFFVAWIIM